MLLPILALRLTFVITGFCICSSRGDGTCGKTFCTPFQTCKGKVCVNTCKENHCEPVEFCVPVKHAAKCACKFGFERGKDDICRRDTNNTLSPTKWLKWVPGQKGDPPPNSPKGGYVDVRDLYICRATYKKELTPGKFLPSEGVCYIAYGDSEIQITANYEVLTGSNFLWLPVKFAYIPLNAVVGGQTQNENLYIGRAKFEDSRTPGKVQLSHLGLRMPNHGVKYFTDYEILVQV